MKTIFALMLLCCSICNGQHRKHVLGMTYLTSPPWYSCIYCSSEVSPNSLLPSPYDTMKIPFDIGDGRKLWVNGYYELLRDFRKKGIDSDSFFIAKWNEKDTSCISSEITLHKSEDIGAKWLKTHKPGIYWLNEEDWMSTRGMVGHKGKDSNYAHGGRFSDSILLADKWYKIDSDLTSPLIR